MKIGQSLEIWDTREQKMVKVTIVSITTHHVVLRQRDGKLWCMTRNDFLSLTKK